MAYIAFRSPVADTLQGNWRRYLPRTLPNPNPGTQRAAPHPNGVERRPFANRYEPLSGISVCVVPHWYSRQYLESYG